MAIETGDEFSIKLQAQLFESANSEALRKSLTAIYKQWGIEINKNTQFLNQQLKVIRDIEGRVKGAFLSGDVRQGDKGKVLSTSGIPVTAPFNIGDKGTFIAPLSKKDISDLEKEGQKIHTTFKTSRKTVDDWKETIKSAAARAAFTIPIWTLFRATIGQLTQALIDGTKEFLRYIAALDDATRKSTVILQNSEKTAANIQQIENTIAELSRTKNIPIEDVGRILRDIQRAGFGVAEAAKIANVATDLMIVGEVDQKTAIEALVLTHNKFGDSISNIVGKEKEFQFIGGLFNKMAKDNVASMEELLRSFTIAAPAGEALGLSVQEIAANVAAINQIGFKGGSGGTILNRLFSREVDLMDKLKQQIKDLGGDASSFGKSPQKDLFLFLDTVINKSKDGATALRLLEQAFGFKGLTGGAGLATNLNLARQSAADVEEAFINLKTTTNGLEKDSKHVTEAVGTMWQRLGKDISQLGGNLLKLTPIPKGLEGAVTLSDKLVGGLNKSFEATKQAGAGFFDIVKKKADAYIDSLTGVKKAQKDIELTGATQTLIPQGQTFADDTKRVTINNDLREQLRLFREMNELRKESFGVIDKEVLAQNKLLAIARAASTELESATGIRMKGEAIIKTIQEDRVEALIQELGLNEEQQKIFQKVISAQEELSNIQSSKEHEFKLIQRERQLDEIEHLKLSGATYKQIHIEKLKALHETGATELELAREKARYDKEQLDRIEEIGNAQKDAFQNNLADLLKNKQSLKEFGTNFGDTIQNSQIDSVAKGLTTAFAGTGFFEQLGISGTALEDAFSKTGNVLIDTLNSNTSRIVEAIRQGPTNFAGAPPGSGGAGGALGAIGGLGALFSGKALPIPKGANGQQISQGQGLFNAGLAGVGGFLAGSQRGTSQGIMGGVGGFLTSAAPFLGALGPLGLVAGAGLTIASMFGGKKKVTEQTQEQTVQIASRIDVTNKKLDVVNRNLVALRAAFETYVLPESAYFSEARNIADNFSLHQRRGLVV
jgi:TP901 family phage tail tape measure protein